MKRKVLVMAGWKKVILHFSAWFCNETVSCSDNPVLRDEGSTANVIELDILFSVPY